MLPRSEGNCYILSTDIQAATETYQNQLLVIHWSNQQQFMTSIYVMVLYPECEFICPLDLHQDTQGSAMVL
jgi:hypothetical protein